MKRQLTRMMIGLIALGLFSACESGTKNGVQTNVAVENSANEQAESSNESKSSAPASAIRCTIDGSIDHNRWIEGQQAIVTFDRFPANLQEFEQVRAQIGREPQGAVALQVMAFELYRRNANEGTKALELNNTSTNNTSCLRQLKEIMSTKDSYYARPYIAAALLKGANPENSYTPTEPYQLEMRVNPVSKYQESEFLGGTVIYLQIDSKGWDTNWRGVEVVKPEGSDCYVVSNCPAMYTQCKKIKGAWNGLK